MFWFLKKYYLSIIASLIIIWLSLSDSNAINPAKFLPFPFSDKVAHLLAYGGFTLVLLFDSCNRKIREKINYSVLFIPVVLGLSMEILQYLLTKTRQADFFDFLADLAGIALCLLFIYLLKAVIPVKDNV
jgi:VanZ family protein